MLVVNQVAANVEIKDPPSGSIVHAPITVMIHNTQIQGMGEGPRRCQGCGNLIPSYKKLFCGNQCRHLAYRIKRSPSPQRTKLLAQGILPASLPPYTPRLSVAMIARAVDQIAQGESWVSVGDQYNISDTHLKRLWAKFTFDKPYLKEQRILSIAKRKTPRLVLLGGPSCQ